MMTGEPLVTIYTTPYCSFCFAAKALLKRKGVSFKEVDVRGYEARLAMMERTQGQGSVPQIFIGETHVGGSDDIHDLERSGRLDPLLQSA